MEQVEREDAIVLELYVAPEDRGKVIGRQGRLARALRTIVRASAARSAAPRASSTSSMSELVTVGRVGRPHGVDGSFFVEEASDAPERFARGATLLVDGVPAEVDRLEARRGRPAGDQARPPRAARRDARRPARRLPEPEEDAYYVFQLVGLAVEEEGGRPLGAVTDVEHGPANDVLVLDSGLLLPLVESCVREIDLDAGRVVVARGFADAE